MYDITTKRQKCQSKSERTQNHSVFNRTDTKAGLLYQLARLQTANVWDGAVTNRAYGERSELKSERTQNHSFFSRTDTKAGLLYQLARLQTANVWDGAVTNRAYGERSMSEFGRRGYKPSLRLNFQYACRKG